MEAFPRMKPNPRFPNDRDSLQRMTSRLDEVHHQNIPLRQRPLPASFWQEPNRQTLPRPEEIFPLCFDPLLQSSFMDQMLAYKLYMESLQMPPASPLSPYPFTDFLYGLKHRTSAPPSKYSPPIANTRLPFLPPYISSGLLGISQSTDKSGSVVKPIATKSQSLSRAGHRYHPFLPPK